MINIMCSMFFWKIVVSFLSLVLISAPRPLINQFLNSSHSGDWKLDQNSLTLQELLCILWKLVLYQKLKIPLPTPVAAIGASTPSWSHGHVQKPILTQGHEGGRLANVPNLFYFHRLLCTSLPLAELRWLNIIS